MSQDPMAAKEAIIGRMRQEAERYGVPLDGTVSRKIEEAARRVAENAGATKNREFAYRPRRR